MTTTRKTLERNKVRRAGCRPRGGAGCDCNEADIRPRISSDAANLKRIIDAGLIVQARLRELSTGDVVDLAMDSMFLSTLSRSGHIIDPLKELEDHGLVHKRETVSRGDSAEYLLTWSAQGRSKLLSPHGDRRGHAGPQSPEACQHDAISGEIDRGSRTGRSRTT